METNTINSMLGETLLTPYSKSLCFVNKQDWLLLTVKCKLLYPNIEITENRIDILNCDDNWSIFWCKYKIGDRKIPVNMEKYLGFVARDIILFFSSDCPQWIKDFTRQLYLT